MTLPSLAPDAPCAAFRTAVDERLDGTLDALRQIRAMTHLAWCPPCLAWVAARHAYRQMMARIGGAVTAPRELRDRMVRLLQRDTASDAIPRPPG